jgi:hypothetical protein
MFFPYVRKQTLWWTNEECNPRSEDQRVSGSGGAMKNLRRTTERDIYQHVLVEKRSMCKRRYRAAGCQWGVDCVTSRAIEERLLWETSRS